MVGCAAYKCSNRSSKKSAKQLKLEQRKTISFHTFPKNPDQQDLWVEALGRQGWVPNENSRLCSEHFEEKCFYRFLNSVQLREDAVPTFFLRRVAYLPKPRRPPLNQQSL